MRINASSEKRGDFTALWGDVSDIGVPLMLVLGGDSVFVTGEDVDQFRRRQPAARIETVPGSGHAVQSDRPRELAALIRDFIGSS
jgi:esterase